MKGLLRRLFRRAPLPQSGTPGEAGTPPPPGDLVHAARPAATDPVDEATRQLRAEIARFENSGTGTPRPSGCWLCEPHTVWLGNRPCRECEQRPPFRLADKPGPR